MSKVYVITKGAYSEYHICAVCLDKYTAEKLVARYSNDYEEANIEEYDTDFNKEIFRFENIYRADWYKNGEIKINKSHWDFVHSDWDFIPKPMRDSYYVYVNADDEEMALKKASDAFAKFRAESIGL